ncbi:MAG TPA: FtsQ-type POTRA domain-containing protein [Thermoanaerobaculia bacterium]|nr:FtsQ-type POTRA domain-containing protein [Thermoanaerobaculia bacterium]
MASGWDTTERFLRPADIGRLRRNQRRIQVQKVLVAMRHALVAGALVLAGLWAWRQTQSDARFSVRKIEVVGAVHTPRAALDSVTRQYAGANLFRIDIARVRHDLGSISWISGVEIEKTLPDTLRIRITERRPVALLRQDGGFRYVDEEGVAFAGLSPSVGNDDLPLIGDASGSELFRTVAALRDIRRRDPALFSRISEIRPVPPRGFRIFDRDLQTTVVVNEEDAVAKWRTLYAIARAENFGSGSIEYADLRFANRIVVKPAGPVTMTTPARVGAPGEIAN